MQRIIEEEKLIVKLRLDNYAIMLYLCDINDQEVRAIFERHLMNK